jgi:hypothetical protein
VASFGNHGTTKKLKKAKNKAVKARACYVEAKTAKTKNLKTLLVHADSLRSYERVT